MPAILALSLHNLRAQPARTLLGVLAISLGVASSVGAAYTGQSILSAIAASQDAQTFMQGLLDQLDAMLGLIGLLVTGAAGFLVLNSFLMSVTVRRRQIGALRLLGTSRRQVLGAVLGEGLLVGLLGAVLGGILGPLLGRGTIHLSQTLLGADLFVFADPGPLGPILVPGVLLGVGISLLAVMVPAWRAAHLSPLAAVRDMPPTGDLRRAPRYAAVGAAGILLAGSSLAISPPGAWVQPPWDIRLAAGFNLLWLACLALALPAVIGAASRLAGGLLSRRGGAAGRLAAGNLGRDRGRVTLTALALALGVALIVAMTGFMRFTWAELFAPRVERVRRLPAWLVAPFDISAGMAAYSGPQSLRLSEGLAADLATLAEGRAEQMAWHFTIVPELSFLGDSYFSFVVDPAIVAGLGDTLFEFNEGDWESALPLMESGCGVLMAPLVAGKNGVGLGDRFPVTGAAGPVECTVAGIGSPYVGASFIGQAAGAAFGVQPGLEPPIAMLVWPQPGTDRARLAADLNALAGRHPGTQLTELETLTGLQEQVIEMLPQMFNALLLLAILAAGLGVVNTTLISVLERRQELGLLWALGATRAQVRRMVMGEAALIGLVGGALGLVAGLGMVVILVLAYGGRAWGVPDLDLWGAALRSARPALGNGLVGLALAPPLSALAARLASRGLFRGQGALLQSISVREEG